jgi:hypothetical protein
MFNPSRDEARQFVTDAWAKFRAGAPLSGLEQIAAGIVVLHPDTIPSSKIRNDIWTAITTRSQGT